MTHTIETPAQVDAQDSPQWELVQVTEYNKDTRGSVPVEKVITTGTSEHCCRKFHLTCGFAYASHHQYSYDTYVIREVGSKSRAAGK